MNQPTASMLVLEAVADEKGVEVIALPCLNRAINADALNTLFSSEFNALSSSKEYVQFQYADTLVTIYGDRTVEIE